METARYARTDCALCHGRGMVRAASDTGAHDWRLCPCTLLSQRQAAAQLVAEKAFPGHLGRMTLDTYAPGESATNRLALTAARNLVDAWPAYRADGGIIGFWGRPAAGKTHLAVGVARACLDRFLVRPLIVSVPQLLRAERDTFRTGGASPVDAAARADLLVLDDLGAEYLAHRGGGRSDVSWVDEQLYLILDERVREARPVIYTTNLSPGDLSDVLSERVASRLERAEVGVFEVEPVPGAARVADERRTQLTTPREDML